MDNILTIDLILNRKKYPFIYNVGYILMIIIAILIYVIATYKYETYYVSKGRIIDGKLELLVSIEDIKYIEKNHSLKIDNCIYPYKLTTISNEIYMGDNYQNYKYVYLSVDNLINIDNYVYEIKIMKENKLLAEYLKEYL